ncbi:hypothetical protein PR202_gb05590 [Eleusine coracana subsp. coracana]|uniref:Uncharacterized protein n=1 Tax=Eleusine coracana subsp. coracana TaxID=191504 RepID=A0AAV5E738_ELECO|nr:hypothetical protein PR202_gb05590 [Eleusine coracana subsp. coracana]
MATAKGFLVFSYARNDDDDDAADDERQRQAFKDLSRLRIRRVDYIYAVFSALTVAFSDTAMQTCYFPVAADNVKQMLTNLPLSAGFLSTMVFLVFPTTTRKGIDYSGPSTNS